MSCGGTDAARLWSTQGPSFPGGRSATTHRDFSCPSCGDLKTGFFFRDTRFRCLSLDAWKFAFSEDAAGFFRSCAGLLVRQPAARARRRPDSRYQGRRAIFEYLRSDEGKGVVPELVWFNENRAAGAFDLRLARSLLRV